MPISTCTVSGYIYDAFGQVLDNKVAEFIPNNWISDLDGIVAPFKVTAITDGTGLITVDLVPGVYKVNFVDTTIAGIRQFTISVPSAATASIQNIADFTGQTRQAGFLDGSAALPAWTFVNDKDTGFYLGGANTLAFATQGVKRGHISPTEFNLNLPMTGTAVTQTTTDTTAGRLVKVGDYGQNGGSAITGITDFNSATTGGNYKIETTTTTNKPGLSGAAGILRVERWNETNDIVQTFIPHFPATSIGRMYIRSMISGVWQTWREVYSQQGVLGTVSQSLGVPTGALIERASNANGEYVRFADGTQFCYAGVNSSASAAVTWTYPAAFAATPKVLALPASGAASKQVTWAARGTTSVDFNVWNLAGGREIVALDVMVVGRWFV